MDRLSDSSRENVPANVEETRKRMQIIEESNSPLYGHTNWRWSCNVQLIHGSIVTLKNLECDGHLSFDVYGKQQSVPGEGYAATASLGRNFETRICFCLERIAGKGVVCFDDEVTLRCEKIPFNFPSPAYLHSGKLGVGETASASGSSVVCFKMEQNPSTYGSTWKVVPKSLEDRIFLEGSPVTLNEPIIFRNIATGEALAASLKFAQSNVFGKEFEVHGKTYAKFNKTATTGDFPELDLIPADDRNLWNMERLLPNVAE